MSFHLRVLIIQNSRLLDVININGIIELCLNKCTITDESHLKTANQDPGFKGTLETKIKGKLVLFNPVNTVAYSRMIIADKQSDRFGGPFPEILIQVEFLSWNLKSYRPLYTKMYVIFPLSFDLRLSLRIYSDQKVITCLEFVIWQTISVSRFKFQDILLFFHKLIIQRFSQD